MPEPYDTELPVLQDNFDQCPICLIQLILLIKLLPYLVSFFSLFGVSEALRKSKHEGVPDSHDSQVYRQSE